MRRMQPLSNHLSLVFRACKILADPTRLAILDLLTRGVQCNCALGDALGLRMNLISHHLKVLRGAGLVKIARDAMDARWIYYSLEPRKRSELKQAIDVFLERRISTKPPVCGPTKNRTHQVSIVRG